MDKNQTTSPASEIADADLIKLFMYDVDVVSAARRLQSTEAYIQILDLYYTGGTQKLDALKELLQKRDLENYTIEVHGLKSASANIGADALSKLAQQHEIAAKASDFAYIEEHANSLFDSYENVLSEIKRILKKMAYGQFAQKESPNLPQITKQDLLARANAVFQQLEDFEPKEAAKGIKELLSYSIEDSVREQLERIQTLLKMYEDEQAQELLHALIQSL